jgi:hypothetical protein
MGKKNRSMMKKAAPQRKCDAMLDEFGSGLGLSDNSPDSEVLISSQVDDYQEEKRFLWLNYSSKVGVGDEDAQEDLRNTERIYDSTPDTSKYGGFDHQVNYSATKYIKP